LCNPKRLVAVEIIMEQEAKNRMYKAYMQTVKEPKPPKEQPHRVAYYMTQTKEFRVSIPKQRGVGQLKNCFGFEGRTNAAAKRFIDECDTRYVDNWEWCDMDGYLVLEMTSYDYLPAAADCKKSIIATLQSIFPYINEWVEGEASFWNAVEGK